MLQPTYQGMSIVVSDSAMRELFRQGKSVHDVVEILEQGHDAPRKRKRNIIERWLDKGNKTFNAVIAKDYNDKSREECWVLIHFGRFTRRRP